MKDSATMAAAKKTTAKKTTAKKTTAKKTTAKKTTAKKTTAKKTTAIRSSALFDIPEVPIQNQMERQLSVASEVKPVVISESLVQKVETEEKRTTKSAPKLLAPIIVVMGVLAGSLLFISNSDSDGGASQSLSETESQVEEPIDPSSSPSDSATPIPSATAQNANIVTRVESRYLFTPTGINLIWEISGKENVDYVQLDVIEDDGRSVSLGKFGSDSTQLELIKEDNQGNSSFRVTLVTKNGSKVIAPTLDVRGKFSAK
jgi:hypothetical protein